MNSLPKISRREALSLGAFSAACVLGWGLRKLIQPATDEPIGDQGFTPIDVPLPDSPDLQHLRRLADTLNPLFSKLAVPQPGEWLAQHVEFGQSFAQFVVDRPEKLGDHYRRIGLVPVGELSETQRRLLADTALFLEPFFGFPVEILEAVPLGELREHARRIRESRGRQVLTRHIIDEILLPMRENDMVAVIGLTSSDLWDGEFGYLFGQGDQQKRACICSMARFGNVDAGEVDYARCLRRTVGLAVHETGHVFGLPHCIAWSCRMNGSNHLAEADRRPLEFCPECLPKIWWTCAVNPADRFSRLADFANAHRLTTEATLWGMAVNLLAAAKNS